jgi:hypothetical protein
VPARPVRHLDLLLVPALTGALSDDVVSKLAVRGVCTSDGRPGPLAGSLVQGGFGRLTVDRPKRTVLYANQQGGFRVFCPACHELATASFVRALEAWRSGGGRNMVCAACARSSDLDALDFRPPAALGDAALIIEDAATGWLTADALSLVTSIMGAVRVVGRRR